MHEEWWSAFIDITKHCQMNVASCYMLLITMVSAKLKITTDETKKKDTHKDREREKWNVSMEIWNNTNC